MCRCRTVRLECLTSQTWQLTDIRKRAHLRTYLVLSLTKRGSLGCWRCHLTARVTHMPCQALRGTVCPRGSTCVYWSGGVTRSDNKEGREADRNDPQRLLGSVGHRNYPTIFTRLHMRRLEATSLAMEPHSPNRSPTTATRLARFVNRCLPADINGLPPHPASVHS